MSKTPLFLSPSNQNCNVMTNFSKTSCQNVVKDLAPAGQILTELYTGNFHYKSVQQRQLWLKSNKHMKRPTNIYVVGLCNSNKLWSLRGTCWGQWYWLHLNIMQACLTMNMKSWALWMWHRAAGRAVQTSQSITVPSVLGSLAYSFLITTSDSQLQLHMIRNTLHSPVGYQMISSFIIHHLTTVYTKSPTCYRLATHQYTHRTHMLHCMTLTTKALQSLHMSWTTCPTPSATPLSALWDTPISQLSAWADCC